MRDAPSGIACRYNGSVMENAAFAVELRISGAHHMFLRYDERAQSDDDVTHNAVCPSGFSGARCWTSGPRSSADSHGDSCNRRLTCHMIPRSAGRLRGKRV